MQEDVTLQNTFYKIILCYLKNYFFFFLDGKKSRKRSGKMKEWKIKSLNARVHGSRTLNKMEEARFFCTNQRYQSRFGGQSSSIPGASYATNSTLAITGGIHELVVKLFVIL